VNPGTSARPVALHAIEEPPHQLGDGLVEEQHAAPQPEPHVRRDLIVPRPRGVELPGELAHVLPEPCLDRHVDVFVLDARPPSRRELVGDLPEARDDLLLLRRW
jgi:hypothetical protein